MDASFAAIVDANWTAVYRLLFSMTGHVSDCEDLTQETFLRALRSWDTFRPGTKLRAWLFRIALNAFFDIKRKPRNVQVSVLEFDPPCREKSVEERFEIEEQGELVRAAMEKLSDQSRVIFHLRVTEDLSFRDIAELTGATEAAARWHMFEARRKLLEHLEGQFAG
jgi:RNA polymerase sigma-70 factor, ECF subfamily